MKQPIFIVLTMLVVTGQTWHSQVLAKKQDSTVELRLLETTDVHTFLANYDYYQTKQDDKVGLVKTATLIKQAKDEVENSMLFDNGDEIQGTPLGDYMAKVKGLKPGVVHPVYRSFNLLGYDATTLGNHEFNYGLDFLKETLNDAKMPVVNANIVKAGTNQPYFKPYVILNKKVVDDGGKRHVLKIVATNNYRASSSTFPGVSQGEIVLKAPDENRQIITN